MPEVLPAPATSVWPDTLAGWLDRCERGHPKAIDLTLDRAWRVKDRLGLSFTAPVIVVGGTNGKGSTCAMLERIALQAGWRVGVYSKPHLVRFEERCRIGGVQVHADDLVPHFAAVEAARGDTTLTYFEHTTLAILRHLSLQRLDLVVLEVGLGGRCDAVNVIDGDCTILTSIDIDHTEYLGPTREAIGLEKAGIWRTGRPAIVGDPAPPAALLALAQRQRVPLQVLDRDFQIEDEGDARWSWHGAQLSLTCLPDPALSGAHQRFNAAAAIAALSALSQAQRLPALAPEVIAAALQSVQLPGRFHRLPGSPQVVLDVAHNRQAVCALAHTLRAAVGGARVVAVFGCMRDKEVRASIAEIAPLVHHWYLTDLPIERAATAAALQAVLAQVSETGAEASSCWASPVAALAAARAQAGPDDWIVAFGSFWTVGGVLAAQP